MYTKDRETRQFLKSLKFYFNTRILALIWAQYLIEIRVFVFLSWVLLITTGETWGMTAFWVSSASSVE